MILVGSAMALGIRPRLAAFALAAMLVPTTLAGHRFWEIEEEQGRSMQVTQFLKNAAMLGSPVQIAASRPCAERSRHAEPEQKR